MKRVVIFTIVLLISNVNCVAKGNFQNGIDKFIAITMDTSIFSLNEKTMVKYLYVKEIKFKKKSQNDTLSFIDSSNIFQICLCKKDNITSNFCYLEINIKDTTSKDLISLYTKHFKIDPQPINTEYGIKYQWYCKKQFYLSIINTKHHKNTITISKSEDYD